MLYLGILDTELEVGLVPEDLLDVLQHDQLLVSWAGPQHVLTQLVVVAVAAAVGQLRQLLAEAPLEQLINGEGPIHLPKAPVQQIFS